jgi:AraC family transcriptional activator of pobA
MNNDPLADVPFLTVSSLNPIPFSVFEFKSREHLVRTGNEEGFYKICLINGNNIIRYANKEIHTEGVHLFLANAYTSYLWEFGSEKQDGYACILSKDFVNTFDCLHIFQQSRLFGTNAIPVFALTNVQSNFVANIFRKIISEQGIRYIFKDELMYAWISLIMHEALKIRTTAHCI